jgi:hypothetical protein
VRTLGTIERTLVILSDLIRGALYDRHAIAQTLGCSLPVADRYIKALAAVPGVKVSRDRRRQIVSWRLADAARAASPELGELVRVALEERAARPLEVPSLGPDPGALPKPVTEYFYGYEVRSEVALRMERNIRIGLMFALRANGETLKAVGKVVKLSGARVAEVLKRAQREIERAADRRFPLPDEAPPTWSAYKPPKKPGANGATMSGGPRWSEWDEAEEREKTGRIRAMVFLLRSNGASLEEVAELVGLPVATADYFDQLVAQEIEEAWRVFQVDGAPRGSYTYPAWEKMMGEWRRMGPRLTCAIRERR